jgi:hypothetical protein
VRKLEQPNIKVVNSTLGRSDLKLVESVGFFPALPQTWADLSKNKEKRRKKEKKIWKG